MFQIKQSSYVAVGHGQKSFMVVGPRSSSEVILSLRGDAYKKSSIFFQMIIGAEENTVTWISLVKKGKITSNTIKIFT